MPEKYLGAGRLVPASALEFSRYAKNLAWLVECPLHDAQDLLARCYGFGSVHELQACLPVAGNADTPTGPFDSPRVRPPYFIDPQELGSREINRLSPLTRREQQLVYLLQRMPDDFSAHLGRRRRRIFAALDGAFFSAPSVHRKKFAEVKKAILAMEGTPAEREAYLECHWPPGFWSFLEGTQLCYVDAQAGLAELKDSSIYYSDDEVMSIADIYHATAAHRAPAVFLEMVGKDPAPEDIVLPQYDFDIVEMDGFPSVRNSRPGLLDIDDYDYWYDAIRANLKDEVAVELLAELGRLQPHELVAAPPAGTPEKVVTLARKWRLHQLRQYSEQYLESEYPARYFAGSSGLRWPTKSVGTEPAGHEATAATLSLVDQAPAAVPYLTVRTELEEQSRTYNDMEHRQLWKFKALLTREVHEEAADVVGYMAGWVVVPASGGFVCDTETLLADAQFEYDDMLYQGLSCFVKAYLPFAGHADLLAFSNSGWNTSVAITEIVLREKYKGQGLMPLAFSTFNQIFQDAAFAYDPPLPIDANFDLEDDPDPLDIKLDPEIEPPGVFMVPVPSNAKRLQRYILSAAPDQHDRLDDELLDVFPFRVEVLPRAQAK